MSDFTSLQHSTEIIYFMMSMKTKMSKIPDLSNYFHFNKYEMKHSAYFLNLLYSKFLLQIMKDNSKSYLIVRSAM